MTLFKHTFLIIGLLACYLGSAQEELLYKTIDTTELYMEVFMPKDFQTDKKYPGMVFFFGGGWKNGSTDQFKPHAEYFSKRGLICFLVDYRVEKRQHTTPFESVKDAKSAIRFIRGHADKFQLDPTKLIASGGSAGGHLAAASALIKDYNDPDDDLSISAIPNALVLFNPVFDNGPGGYGYGRIGDAYKNFSPLHNLREGAPPTLILLGTKDHLVPVETAEYYQIVMEKMGSRCELKLFENQRHGFFNYKNFKNYQETVLEADRFLVSLGFLGEEPKVKIE
ncbi:alpha/beta hydrolase [Gaetbulibacter sp. M240]|uniref:alpha/beta hydrolase n=1 Tax=Gaetbulibacter sp. M240 TaxID=3126511 RepID=UPI00374EF866